LKILVSSDIHGNATLLNQLKEKARDVHLVLYCGDVARNPAGTEAQKPDLDSFIATFDEISAPCRFVRGNCDNFETDSEYFLKGEEKFGDVRVIPFEDILTTPFGTFREVSEEQIERDLADINGNGAIILAHQPPYGAGDDIGGGIHVGSKSISTWIKSQKPLYWLCGHVHEGNGEYSIDETKVINAAADSGNNNLRAYIIEV